MSKSVKIWLIIAASLTLIGAIIFSGVMMALNWDFSKISTVKYETNGYEFNDAVCKNIKVITNTADISFVPSTYLKVVCYEETKAKHIVTVQDDTLVIEAQNNTFDTHNYLNQIKYNDEVFKKTFEEYNAKYDLHA